MTIEDAAHALESSLREMPWFTAVGVGSIASSPTLFLYVRSTRGIDKSRFKDGWYGYRVEIKRMGTPRFLVA